MTTPVLLDETTTPSERPAHVDVLIVGAGLSGIGAACHLQTTTPGTSYAIVEARAESGGTWDLFRYPGVRSDSDMFTLGYTFQPWKHAQSIVGGDVILDYIRKTATDFGIDQHIRYNTQVLGADWSSEQARWTVTVKNPVTGEVSVQTCGFLYLCSGYYKYDAGYTPDWPGREHYTGQVVHPQSWPAELDLTGKKVVVVGSGATAVTLVPALAETAAQVTMLQRSPSYVVALPAEDPIADLLRKVLPEQTAYRAIRWKNIKVSGAIYGLSRRFPQQIRGLLRKAAVKQLPVGFDVDTHFSPSYDPWDQRMCMVPGGDFFTAIRDGKADIVTDHIEAFTPTGFALRSGATLDADVIVTATGLNLLPLGGLLLTVDGAEVTVSERVAYKGMMLDGVPNLAFALGYTNASWTLKVDMVSDFLGRLLQTMAQGGHTVVTPQLPSAPMVTTPFIDMASGYFERSRTSLPRQGDRAPWRLRQHYGKDSAMFSGAAEHDALEFSSATVRAPLAAALPGLQQHG